jgi:Lar family restriction alleviation protein
VSQALPCPFCGSTDIVFEEGSTFRWKLAVCDSCGVKGPEVRVDTLSQDRTAALEQGRKDAIDAWNKRVTP